MVAIKPKLRVQQKLLGECTSHARTDVSVRDVELTIDEPEARGGTNMGMTPTETFIAALIGCTNVISHKIAEANGVTFEAMTVEADATFDRRGVALEEEIDLPYPAIKLTINVTTSADDAAIDKIKNDLGRYCAVAKMIRQAGTEITEVWTVTRP